MVGFSNEQQPTNTHGYFLGVFLGVFLGIFKNSKK
jgi:hypothetical protein